MTEFRPRPVTSRPTLPVIAHRELHISVALILAEYPAAATPRFRARFTRPTVEQLTPVLRHFLLRRRQRLTAFGLSPVRQIDIRSIHHPPHRGKAPARIARDL